MSGSTLAESGQLDNDLGVRQLSANGSRMKTSVVEEKLDEGNIQEAESALREGLSLNFEEARALLGRLEYQRGNVEGALRVFDGIDLQAAIQRMQSSITEKIPSKKGRSRGESMHAVPQNAAGLVLEAVYLKAKSLQKLGRLTDAAQECKSVLDAVEKMFARGISDVSVDNKLQETVSHAVELLPELWKLANCYPEAMSAYRRALLSRWNLDNECCSRIQKNFAVFLLYSGVEIGPPSLAVQIDGSYVPRNNMEEAILLLMVLLRKCCLGHAPWDPSVIEHLTYALSVCSQTSVLAKEIEEILPGLLHRTDRWKLLSLCFSASGQIENALNLLRKTLRKHENADDTVSLLLAAKMCSSNTFLAAEGLGYALRATDNAQGVHKHLEGAGLRVQGLCLGKLAKVSSSDSERSHLQSEALKSLDRAFSLEPNNSDLIFELGVQYAERRNLSAALRYAKQYIDITGGSVLRGWRLLALVLSAQKRYPEALVVIDTALDETAKWEQGSLLRMKAKLKISQSLHVDAIETYRYLLALVQVQRKSYGTNRIPFQAEDDRVNEYEVWHGLANLYSSLSHWGDAEICLDKARALVKYSAETLHTEASMPLEDLLASSFGVHYKINHTACSDCGKSGGECWKNTDSGVDPKCLRQPGYAVGSSYQVPQKGNNTVSGRKIIIAASAAGGGMLLLLSVLLLLVLFILCCRKKTKNGSSGVSQNVSSNNVMSESEKGGTYMGIPTFSYSELEEATNNFDSNYELGNGGFGTVYKGKLRDGREVAVKRVYENSFKRVEQFMNEIMILTGLRHPNLVVLYGSTSRECKMLLLVYEYIPNGTIADHLNRDSAQPGNLTWNTRMSIAIETASALLYLHVSDVIHRDVKTTNILLDNSFRVKVADFGLSRLFPTNVTHVSTVPQGTPGYVDPEYYQCYQLTDKSDVYSFGVVLIELISSMPAVDISRHRHEINLANLAIKKIQGDALHELVDPTLGFESDEGVRKMITDVAELALMCLQNERELRPSMEEVHRSLKEIQRTDCAERNFENLTFQ